MAMKLPLKYLVMAAVLPVLAPAQSFVMVLLEEFHVQTSASTTALQQANFWAEVGDVAGVTSATVSASAGVLYEGAHSLQPVGGNFEYKASFPDVAQLLAAYPSNATYTMALTTGTDPFARDPRPRRSLGLPDPAQGSRSSAAAPSNALRRAISPAESAFPRRPTLEAGVRDPGERATV
jgi:hypothetical protein